MSRGVKRSLAWAILGTVYALIAAACPPLGVLIPAIAAVSWAALTLAGDDDGQ
jgi:hypothetical protein